MKHEHHYGRLITSLIACLLPGYVALYLFTTSIPGWYSTLKKPDFVPSDLIVFYGIILLFCLFGISLYLIWSSGIHRPEAKAAFSLFVFTLTILELWFIAFFYLEAAFFAFVIIVMVNVLLFCTIAQTLRAAVKPVFFLVPCLILTLIACYVNLQIVMMNAGIPAWGIVP